MPPQSSPLSVVSPAVKINNILKKNDILDFKRPITTERIYFSRPINYVAMMARISGHSIAKILLEDALIALLPQYPLIISRFQTFKDGVVLLVPQKQFHLHITVSTKDSEEDWVKYCSHEHMTYFDCFNGPLIRFSILNGPKSTDLLIICHHSICDGLSLKYLIHDIVDQLTNQAQPKSFSRLPPVIDESMLPIKPGSRFQRILIKFLNRIWKNQKIKFTEEDFSKLNQKYWSTYKQVGIQTLHIPESILSPITKLCKKYAVTMHSLLVTALILAQNEIQNSENGGFKKYQRHFHMPVNMRRKYQKSIERDFGFYASSLILNLEYCDAHPFWENVVLVHKVINLKLRDENLYQLLRLNLINPTLLDSLYFQKLGIINNKISRLLVKKMGIMNPMAGIALTNLGKDYEPVSYPPYHIDAIYGPSVYSEILEKIVSAITLNNQMFLTFTFEESIISNDLVNKVRVRFEEILSTLA